MELTMNMNMNEWMNEFFTFKWKRSYDGLTYHMS